MKIKDKDKNKILIALSCLVLFISFMSAWRTNVDREIVENGFEVVAEVVYKTPEDCSNFNRRASYCELKYNNKVFNKRILDRKYCYLLTGKKKIKVLTNEKNTDLLFMDEYNRGDFGYSILFLILAILGIRQGCKGVQKSGGSAVN